MNDENDWRRKIIKAAETIVEEAQPKLLTIIEDAAREHRLHFVRPEMTTQAAAVFHDIQSRSFQLGIQAGIGMVLKSLDEAEETEERKAV